MTLHSLLSLLSSAIESQGFFFSKKKRDSASYPVSRFITTWKGTVLSPAIPMSDETKTKLRAPIWCERPFEAEQKIQIHNCLGRLVRTLRLLCFCIGGVQSMDTFGNRFERVFLELPLITIRFWESRAILNPFLTHYHQVIHSIQRFSIPQGKDMLVRWKTIQTLRL